MKKFELNVVRFNNEDVIATSAEPVVEAFACGNKDFRISLAPHFVVTEVPAGLVDGVYQYGTSVDGIRYDYNRKAKAFEATEEATAKNFVKIGKKWNKTSKKYEDVITPLNGTDLTGLTFYLVEDTWVLCDKH